MDKHSALQAVVNVVALVLKIKQLCPRSIPDAELSTHCNCKPFLVK